MGQRDKLILEVLGGADNIATPEEFMAWMAGPVVELLPHEIMVCGIGEVGTDGSFIQKFLNRDYPLEYYFELRRSDGKVNSPLMQRWRETKQPVFFQAGRDDHLYPQEWVTLFNKHELRNIIGHGIHDLHGPFSSYFIFSRFPGEIGQFEIETLKLITPYLHHALGRVSPSIPVFDMDAARAQKLLSDRQLQILQWVNNGKSNWEIANIVNTTQANVKYHLDQIYQKLGVATRVQAVAKAKDLGILKPSHLDHSMAR